MNIDGSLISELFDLNKMNTKNASVQVNSTEYTRRTGAFFDDENTIKSVENVGDAYDRLVSKPDTSKTGDRAVNPEIINQMADVVTPENYSKYEELGIEPDKDDPTSILTVSERIEIELATHCDNYEITGSISRADLETMYGTCSVEINKALDKLNSLNPISEKTSEYLLTNNLSLSINNIYKAEHSTSAKSDSNLGTDNLSDEEWQELKPQIEKMLNENGFELSERNMKNAKWLVESKIPVNSENIYKMSKIDEINNNLPNTISDAEWISNIAENLAYGLSAGETSADYYSSISMDSAEAVEIINNGTSEQVTTLVTDGKEVTLLNMKKSQEDNTYKTNEKNSEEMSKDTAKKVISERKNLEELRLKLTIEASATMIKNGINIEITPLANLVEELKSMEDKYVENVFAVTGNTATDEDVNLFISTMDYVDKFLETPSYVLGNVLNNDIEFNIESITDEGSVKESVLKSAEMAYDTLGTKPDRELGDSLKKAFTGIDSMLESLDMKEDVENERAVRILAYNELAITKENIEAIKGMDLQVTELIENLAPRTTAYLIANGINPLKTNISELNDELQKINEKIGTDEVEKYSEFLWKLDKNKQIEKEDREAYIGIYRLVKMIEKGDRKAIGAVLKQGSELTMKNLLTAARSYNNLGMEVSVDDDLGAAESVKLSDNNIDKQLNHFESAEFAKRADKYINEMLEQNAADEIKYGINELKAQEVQEVKMISEEAFRNIYEDGTNTTNSEFLGITYYVVNKGRTYSKIKDACEDETVNKSIEEIEKVMDGEGDSDELSEKINSMTVNIKEALLNKSQIDISEIRMINKMVNYINRASENNSYYIPTEIDGNLTTIKVTMEQGSEEQGKVRITINSEDENSREIKAEFTVKNDEVKGLIMAENEDLSKMKGLNDKLNDKFKKINLNLKSLSVTDNFYTADKKVSMPENKTTTNTLLNVAKVYISCVKN